MTFLRIAKSLPTLLLLSVLSTGCTDGFQLLSSSSSSLSPGVRSSQVASLFSAQSPQDFGAKGDCIADDTQAIQAFFKVGGTLPAPAGECYRVTTTIKVPSNVKVVGAGATFPRIKLDVPMGSPARSVLDLSGSGLNSTTGVWLENFSVDGGNGGGAMRMPELYSGNIGSGAAILVQSSDTVLAGLVVINAWDNGIGLAQFKDLGNGNFEQRNDWPQNVHVNGIACANNGMGTGLGACVNVLTASNNITVSNSADHGSAVGFSIDYWGGAGANFDNLTTEDNKENGFWIGSSNGSCTLNNLTSYRSGKYGITIDYDASNANRACSVNNLVVRDSFRDGVFSTASGWTINNASVSGQNRAGLEYVEFHFGGLASPSMGIFPGDMIAPPMTDYYVINSNGTQQRRIPPGSMSLWQNERIGNDHFFLTLQSDGNLVLYVDYQPRWQSGTTGYCPAGNCRAFYQADGNLVIYDNRGPVWATGSNGSQALLIRDQAPYLKFSQLKSDW